MLRMAKRDLHYVTVAAAITTIVFFLISLGPIVRIAGRSIVENPVFYLFYNVIPLLQATRFVPEFGFVSTIFGLIVFAAVAAKTPALDRLFWLQCPGVVVIPLLAAAVFLENFNPEQLHGERVASGARAEPAAIPAYQALGKLRAGPVLSLPMTGLDEYNYLYFSLDYRGPTFNGITGFTPLLKQKLTTVFGTFPSPEAINYLKLLNIDYLVLHKLRWGKPVSHCSEILPPQPLNVVYDDRAVCIVKIAEPGNGRLAIQTYKLGDVVSFGDRGNFGDTFLKSFAPSNRLPSRAGPTGRPISTWMVGTKASLVFSLDRVPTASDLMLSVQFELAFWPAVGRELVASVWANGTLIGDWRIDQSNIHENFSAMIPASVIASATNRLAIEFHAPPVPSPSELMISADDRHLTLSIETLRISPSNQR